MRCGDSCFVTSFGAGVSGASRPRLIVDFLRGWDHKRQAPPQGKPQMHVHDRTSSLRALRIALASTAVLLVLETAGGLVSGSLALLADAPHVLTDVPGLPPSYTA